MRPGSSPGFLGLAVVLATAACSGQDLEDDRKAPSVAASPTPRGGADQGAKGTIAGLPQEEVRNKETNAAIFVTPGTAPSGNGTVTSGQASDSSGEPKIITSGTGPTSGTMASTSTSTSGTGGPDANVLLVARAATMPAAPQSGVESLRAKFCTVRAKSARPVSATSRLSKVEPGTGFTTTPLPAGTTVPEGTQFVVHDVSSFTKDGKEGFVLMAYGYDDAGALVRFEAELPDDTLESECKLTKGRYFSLTGTENATLRKGMMGTVTKPLYLKSAFP